MRVDTWARRSQQPLENVITPHDGHHLYLRSAAPAESHHLPPPCPRQWHCGSHWRYSLHWEFCQGLISPGNPGTHWQNDSHYGAVYHCIKLPADVLQITFHNQNTAHLATNFLALHDYCLNCVSDQKGNCGTTWEPFLSTSSIQCQLELTPFLCKTWILQNHNYLFSF